MTDGGAHSMPVPPELHVSPAQPFRRRAMTFATFEPLKLNPKWKERMLRPRLDVRRVFGESDLPSSELGPRASAAKWARLNRARPWWARMVHPNSFERRLWDAVTSVFVLLQVAQVPLQLMFSWWPYLSLSADTLAFLNKLMRLWFAAELVLNLRTGCVTTDGTLIMDARTSLRRRLLSGWLLVDLLGVMNPHDSLVPPHAEAPTRQSAGGLAGLGQRIWRVSARVVRFSSRVVQGKLLRRDQMADAWAVSALAYRCKRGTADTALSYCEWHESAFEQWLSIWRLCRQFHVTRILQSAHAIGYFWQTFHMLAAIGCWADRIGKLLYLTKWAKLRRLLHLAQLWRIGRKWLAVRRAQTREALRVVQDSLVRSLSRHTGLDALAAEGLCSSLSRGELGSAMRVISNHASRHAGLDALGMGPLVAPLVGPLGQLGARVASVPARLSELMPPSPIAERFFNELRTHQMRAACAREAAWLEAYGESFAEPASMRGHAASAAAPSASSVDSDASAASEDTSASIASLSSVAEHGDDGVRGGQQSNPSPAESGTRSVECGPRLRRPRLGGSLLAPGLTPRAPRCQ